MKLFTILGWLRVHVPKNPGSPVRWRLWNLALLFLAPAQLAGFSLLGPYAPWMEPRFCYHMRWDLGGPVDIQEEYRWNVPIVTYAFDQTFLDYFGSNGVAAVEQAIQILNELPPASAIVPTSYPLDSRRWLYPPTTPSLYDLKSATLALLLHEMGLAEPTRNVFTFRQWNPELPWCADEVDWPEGTIPNYILQRNFDPETLSASHYVNGTFYTGLVIPRGPPADPYRVFVWSILLDPMQTWGNAAADWLSADPWALDNWMTSWMTGGTGGWLTGLTYDDVGGLRYLLSTNNVNWEILPPDVRGSEGEWVNLAMRPGVEKITFIRHPYDMVTGQALRVTNQFIDTYITNGITMRQQVERVIGRPDFLFSAAELGADDFSAAPYACTGASNWWNSSKASGGAELGPGVILPGITITFNKRGPLVETDFTGYPYLDDYQWGSFDSRTNPPITYPCAAYLQTNNQLNVHFWLRPSERNFTWRIPLPAGNRVLVQTSTNLMDWTPVTTLTNRGSSVIWNHFDSESKRFFRALPQ